MNTSETGHVTDSGQMDPSLLLAQDSGSQPAPLFDSTRLTIISRSPTRRVILAKIFRHFFPLSSTDFSAIGDPWRIPGDTDLLLVDKHNVGPEYASRYKQLLDQTAIPLLIIDSSQIPAAREARRAWASTTAEQMISLYLDFHHGLITMGEAATEAPQDEPAPEQNPTLEVAELMEEIGSEVETRRLNEILDNLPMQQYHEIDNDRPLVTADEWEFDFSAADEFQTVRNNVVNEQAAKGNNASELPDFSDFDEIFGKPAGDDPSRLARKTGHGTLTTWFSAIFARLRSKQRKAS